MRKLTLHKPALDDYVDVEKDLNENYRKIEEWANSSGTELDNKFDDGGVSTDYDTAKKMEDKIKFLATQIEKTPIGTILPFAGGTIPKDYLLCDGREITKNDYSELYDILPFGGYIDEKVFRGLAKNEVPNMTGPTLNGYTITESSVFSATFPGWKAFDSVISGDNGGWASLTGQKEGWVQIQYPNKRALSSFTIKTRTYAPGSKLEKISVCGVTTTSEDELFTENLSRAFTTNEKREFKVNFNKKTYDKFKIKVSAPNDQYCAIDEIELFTVDITQFPNHKQETTKKYLPDLRGQFLRGIKDGRKLLDWESEDIKKHNHKEPLAYPPESSVTNTLKEYTEVREKKTIFQTLMLDDNVNDNVYGRPIAKETYEGNETRPSNIGVNYIIKAKNGINDNSIPAYIESLLNDLNNLKNNLGANIKDNSISSSKLKTDSDADKIKLANLAEEVINSMSKLTKDSVVREYIADGAINDEKIEKHSISHKSLNKDIFNLIFADGENMLNPNTMTSNARLKRDGSIETFESSSYTISDYIYVAPYDTITVDHRKSSNIVNDYLGCWYDSNKKYIRAVEHTDYSFSDTKKDIITIPSNAAYMRRNFWGGQKKVILVGSTEIFEDKNYTGIKKFTDDNFYISENKLKYDIQNKKGVYITGNGNNPGLFNIPFNVKIEKETLEINDIVRAEISVSTDDENFRGLRLGCIGIASVVSNNYKNLSVVETLKAELKITKQITGDWKINLGFEGKLGKDLELIVSDLKIFVNDSPVNIKTITPARQYGFKKYILLPFNKLDYKTRSILETVNNNSLTPHCWSNIKWKTIGDSITESNRTALKNYHKLISELTGIQVTNSGLSKRGYWGPTGSSFHDQLANTTDGEFDIITIFGSPNDREMFINNKGDLTDNMDLDIPVDDNYTYCARVNKCLRKATEFLKTKVVVIGPLPTSYDNYYGELLNKPQENIASGPSGYCMREMDEILEKLCSIWNIPYLSLFKKGLLKPWVTEQNTAFFKQDGVGRPSYNPDAEPDGLHPNTAGHMMIAPIILNFLKEHIAIETQFEKTGDENFYIPE